MSDQEDVKPDRICTTLSDAVLQWADPDLLADFMQAREKGHSFAYIFGKDPAADRLADPYCRAVDGLRGSLIAKLKAEELVAYAFDSRSPAETDRTRIHPGRWRVLTPDFDNDTAAGGGLELYDVLVTTPDLDVEIVPEKPVVPAPAEAVLVLMTNLTSVQCQSLQIKLTSREYQLLKILAVGASAGKPVISKEDIYAEMFAPPTSPEATKRLMYELRAQLEPLGKLLPCGEMIIETLHSQGYRLKLAPDQVAIEG